MTTLYILPGACSLAAHIALAWAGAAYQVTVLSHDEAHGDAYLAVNPKGVVPSLRLDDGVVITESLAVLTFIADAFPHAELGAPIGDARSRARLNEALSDLTSDVHDAWSPFWAPSRFVTREANEADAREAAFKRIDEHYARLERIMADRDWRLFGRRTVADAYLYVMCGWKDKSSTPLAHYPSLNAFKARLDADEGVRRALAEEPDA